MALAPLQALAQQRIVGHSVQRIGIEHQARAALQNFGQQGGDAVPAATAASHGAAFQLIQCGHLAAQHDFWLLWQMAGLSGIEQVQKHASSTVVQCGHRRQNGGALHSGTGMQALASDHQYIAKTAFVAGVLSRQGGRHAAEPCAGWYVGQRHCSQSKVVQPDGACSIAPLCGEKPRVQGQQTECVLAAVRTRL